jgi:hypothetical protein
MNMEQWWNDIFAGETEVLRENLPSATLSTTNPIWIDPGANPGLRGERPATNRLSHGTALGRTYLRQKEKRLKYLKTPGFLERGIARVRHQIGRRGRSF